MNGSQSQKVAILGFSVIEQSENLPLYRYFKARGADITAFYWGGEAIAKQLPADIHAIEVADKNVTFTDLEQFDLIVRSPIIHPRQVKTTKPITTLTNIFMEACPAQVIGVTGTKGKGTTSTLIARMLEAAGKTVHMGGNIGLPLLDVLPNIQPSDIVVYEMSNFQLIDATRSPQIATCVMVVPEHLDWHADAQEYYEAKANIFAHQTAGDTAVYNAANDVSTQLAQRSPAQKIWYQANLNSAPSSDGAYTSDGFVWYGSHKICATSDIALLGDHNQQNICAAVATVWDLIEGNIEAITSVIRSFSGLEHRLQLVRSLDGVDYFDDSFSTTPETAVAAIKAFTRPKVLILGGHDKGVPFDLLCQEVANTATRAVILIGQTAPTLKKLIASYDPQGATHVQVLPMTVTMVDIVEKCYAAAQPGDVVLLSPGCASYGMFTDYKDRAKQFVAAVNALDA